MNQLPLFDGRKSRALKRRGMASAARRNKFLLDLARGLAESIAHRGDGTANMDQVVREMNCLGIDASGLGNAAGSVFRGNEWEFTGRYVKSQRVSAHARDIKVWKLK